MVFLLFFLNVSIAYRGGGWDRWWGGVGSGKIPRLGHPQTMAHATLIDH